MALESPVPRSTAGIVLDANGRKVPTTLRADGTERKERKIRPGFTPLEDIGRFRSPRVAERAAREGSPQLGAGLGGRSLESWANDALNDQGMQASSPVRGPYGGGQRSTPSFRAPPSFPSLVALEDALPTPSPRANGNLPPHQAPLDPSTSSTPSSPPPRRPWPSRSQPSTSTDINSVASTPPTRSSSPPQPSLHADLLNDNKLPPSPASYSKNRRLQGNGAAPSSQPHTVQSDWNAAKHCFTAPPKPSQHRRISSSSAGKGASPQAAASSAASTAPPSAFTNVPRTNNRHRRSASSSSSNTSKSTVPRTSPSIPQSPPPRNQRKNSASSIFASPPAPHAPHLPAIKDLISIPAPSPIESPPLIIVKLPPSRVKLTPPIVQPVAPPPATFNNKPIPTGPRNPTSAAPKPAARVGGSWGVPKPTAPPAAAPTVAPPLAHARKASASFKLLPLHLAPIASIPNHSLPTPPAPTPPITLVPTHPLPSVVKPPRAKSEGGTWGLKAKSTFASTTTIPFTMTPTASPVPLEVAVHLPPSEEKLAPAPRVSVPMTKRGKGGQHARGNSNVFVPAPVVNKQAPVAVEKREPPPHTVPTVVEPEPTKAQEVAVLVDDPATWGVPLSGRSWADDEDSF